MANTFPQFSFSKSMAAAALILVAVLAAGLYWGQERGQATPAEQTQMEAQLEASSSPEFNLANDMIEGTESIVVARTFEASSSGQTALELLEEQTELGYTQYDFGVFIESVNGLSGNEKFFWALYVNGEFAQKGADQIVLEEGDTVEVRYQAVDTPAAESLEE